MNRIFLLIIILIFSQPIQAQPPGKVVHKINGDWQFFKGNTWPEHLTENRWQNISIPHTWNVEDALDDSPGYYRGACWYKKIIQIDTLQEMDNWYLYFEGANQAVEVYLNGELQGVHEGGYTGFYIRLRRLSANTDNIVTVRVDNRHSIDIPPLSADFTFYGGIYRDVYLLGMPDVHFSRGEYGDHGVQWHTVQANKKGARVSVKQHLDNLKGQSVSVLCKIHILDQQGKLVSHKEVSIQLAAQEKEKEVITDLFISEPKLWSPEQPNLYTLITEIWDAKSNQLLDVQRQKMGVRFFRFSTEKGFFLNDQPYKLIGTSRHQDYQGKGNALTDSISLADIVLLKEMGANFLRISHYPQDPAVLQACDSLGILASVEIPIVDQITESDAFNARCKTMLLEMLRQNYNHPSVIIWCYMNEVLIHPLHKQQSKERINYYRRVKNLATELDSMIRMEDPERYTMMAFHGDYDRYRDAGLIEIPMITGWNLYYGWYGGSLDEFPVFLDRFHKEYPKKILAVTEYGADADSRIRSMHPITFDKSVEYSLQFHQSYFAAIEKRPFVAAGMIWNLADFGSAERRETTPHMNNKGLLTWDRHKKDVYNFYAAALASTPTAYILGGDQLNAIADSGRSSFNLTIQAATNQQALELYVDGISQGTTLSEKYLCSWQIAMEDGIHRLEVVSKKGAITSFDNRKIQVNVHPYYYDAKDSFRYPLRILFGTDRLFTDQDGHQWIPEQQWHQGGWGYIGGEPYKMTNNRRLPYGTDRNILGTVDDPVYQTQRVGIRELNFDVPAGRYQLIFHFAELMGDDPSPSLVYNLNSDQSNIRLTDQRVFNVFISDSIWLNHLNIATQVGINTPLIKSFEAVVSNQERIHVRFDSIVGMTAINAIEVLKISDK